MRFQREIWISSNIAPVSSVARQVCAQPQTEAFNPHFMRRLRKECKKPWIRVFFACEIEKRNSKNEQKCCENVSITGGMLFHIHSADGPKSKTRFVLSQSNVYPANLNWSKCCIHSWWWLECRASANAVVRKVTENEEMEVPEPEERQGRAKLCVVSMFCMSQAIPSFICFIRTVAGYLLYTMFPFATPSPML